MTEPHWTSYVGMVTGVVGATTGIAGAIMGYFGYRYSKKLKSLDLRVELRKAINDVHIALNRVKELIKEANESGKALFAARGMSSEGGLMQEWKKEITADNIKIGELSNRAPKAESSYDTLGVKELESELIAVHKLQGDIQILLDKYSEAIRSDEEQLKELREEQRVRYKPYG